MIGTFLMISVVLVLPFYIIYKKHQPIHATKNRKLFLAAGIMACWIFTFLAFKSMGKIDVFLRAEWMFLSIYTLIAMVVYFALVKLSEKIKREIAPSALGIFSVWLIVACYQTYNQTRYLPTHLCESRTANGNFSYSYNPVRTEWQYFFNIDPKCR